jgi:hypothetical protein
MQPISLSCGVAALAFLVWLGYNGGGTSSSIAQTPPPATPPPPSARPCGIYILDSGTGTFRDANIREYPFVTGYVLRPFWSDLEVEQGAYDFRMIDHIIRQLEALGQKLSIELLPGEPSYIAQTPGVTTWVDPTDEDNTTTVRPVPWDPFLLERLRAFVQALAEHRLPNAAAGGGPIRLRDHPVLANLNFSIAGIGANGIRDIEANAVNIVDFPGTPLQVQTGGHSQPPDGDLQLPGEVHLYRLVEGRE